jgi:deoxyribose-phosphate aldolase
MTFELAHRTELSLFRADATAKDIEKLCAAAREQKIYGVCVGGSRVELAASLLEDSAIKTTALVGFPLGSADSDVKRYETEVAIDFGAQEIEMVLNVGRLKDGDHKYVLRELRDIAEAADERIVKVILQTHLLTREEILVACELVLDSGAHFVFTGSHGPANPEHVKLLREAVGEKFGVKAIGDAKSAMTLVAAGATRLGFIE